MHTDRSQQKGIDLIADLSPLVLEEFKDVQIIAVGPVIDLHGKFAAQKLLTVAEMYPGRLCVKPKFTVCPPALFSGADFALIPSRDEPFGLVAVEFGRRGALSIGCRIGGLGQMPGWWYTYNSDSPEHLLRQFSDAIRQALASAPSTRETLRVEAAEARFPVSAWRLQLLELYRSCRDASRIENRSVQMTTDRRASVDITTQLVSNFAPEPPKRAIINWPVDDDDLRRSELGYRRPPLMDVSMRDRQRSRDFSNFLQGGEAEERVTLPRDDASDSSEDTELFLHDMLADILQKRSTSYQIATHEGLALRKVSPNVRPGPGPPASDKPPVTLEELERLLELPLQLKHGQDMFNDADGTAQAAFVKDLSCLTPKTSIQGLCIDSYLSVRRKRYFQSVRASKYGVAKTWRERIRQKLNDTVGWPVYCLLLTFGQVLGVAHVQLLVMSQRSQDVFQICLISTMYAAATVAWYVLSRVTTARLTLAIPFSVYAFAFLLLGGSFLADDGIGLQRAGLTFYSAASASGYLFFSFNWADEPAGRTHEWVNRAWIVNVLQLVWLLGATGAAQRQSSGNTSIALCAALFVLAAVCSLCGVIVAVGLDFGYYKALPGSIPAFWSGLLRRKLVVWFIVSTFASSFWLSLPTSQAWTFLYQTQLTLWGTWLLSCCFAIPVYVALSLMLTKQSRLQTWFPVIIGIGLSAVRYLYVLWASTGTANDLPSLRSAVLSSIIARAVLLWLIVLDSIQATGMTTMLLQTTARYTEVQPIRCCWY